jgi:hypothetical protein
MALSIDILVPAGTVHYEEDVGGVHKINVHFYFANVVMVVIYFDDLSRETYYQVPVILYTPPPIP